MPLLIASFCAVFLLGSFAVTFLFGRVVAVNDHVRIGVHIVLNIFDFKCNGRRSLRLIARDEIFAVVFASAELAGDRDICTVGSKLARDR